MPPSIRNAGRIFESWLTVSFLLKQACSWAEVGHEISWFQHRLDSPEVSVSRTAAPSPVSDLSLESTPLQYNIKGSKFSLEFNKAFGRITSWKVNGISLFDESWTGSSLLTPAFWRAPTDNDLPTESKIWKQWGLENLTTRVRSVNVDRLSRSAVEIVVKSYIAPPILAWGFDTIVTYRISGDGSLAIKVLLNPRGSVPRTLPRVGLDLRLHPSLDNARWFGLGPGESYPDKKLAQKVGIYSASTADLHTPYEVPQENGNRTDSRWVQMVDQHGVGLRASCVGKGGNRLLFHWAASKYSAAELERASHPPELVSENAVFFRLDAEQAGLGTAACGPGVRKEYQVRCSEKEFEFKLESVQLQKSDY